MNIRLAAIDDAEPLARVHVRSWQVAYRGMIPDEILDSLDLDERSAGWRSTIAQGDQVVLVAADITALQGFCSFGPARDESEDRKFVAEITSIYVDPDHWGRGVGGALCSSAIARAGERGFRGLVLWVLEANARARAFYERLGFERDPARGFTRSFGGVELAEICYRMTDLGRPVGERHDSQR